MGIDLTLSNTPSRRCTAPPHAGVFLYHPESSGHAFALDVADLFRSSTALPIAFRAAKKVQRQPGRDIEPTARKMAGSTLRDEDVIPDMIDHIKDLLDRDA